MKIKQILLKISWQEIILFFAIMIVGLPALFVDWMIVDDGVLILRSEKLSLLISNIDWRGLLELFVEKEPGRFRPAYWLYQWSVYLLVGKSAFLQHAIHFVLSGSTVLLMYLTIKKITSSRTASLISCLLFLLAPFNIENWYRLGPQEPIMTFYLVLVIFCLVKILRPIILEKEEKSFFHKYYFIFSFFCLLLAFLTKETSIAIVPFLTFLLIGSFLVKRKKSKKEWIKVIIPFIILSLFLSLLVFLISLMLRQGGLYATYYDFSLKNFLDNGRWYTISVLTKTFIPFSVIFILSFLYNLLVCVKSRNLCPTRFFQFAFIVGFISFLLIQLPWDIPMGRYLEPAFVFFVLICGIETSYILRLGHQRIQILIFSLAFLFLLITGGFTILNYTRDVIMGQAKIAQTLSYIASEAPTNTKIFWNLKNDESTKELIFESNLHLALFYKRPDLKIEYLDDQVVGKLVKGDLVMTVVDSKDLILYKEDELTRDERLSVLKVIPHEVVKYILHPRSGLKILISAIWPSITPAHAFLEKIENKGLWKIYEIREN